MGTKNGLIIVWFADASIVGLSISEILKSKSSVSREQKNITAWTEN